MKTFLKASALGFAAALPATFAAEILGVSLPAVLESGPVFGFFVATLVTLTVVSDYAPASALPTRKVTALHGKAAHPLAA